MPNDQINKVSGVHKVIVMTSEQSTPRLKSETQFHGRTGNQKNSRPAVWPCKGHYIDLVEEIDSGGQCHASHNVHNYVVLEFKNDFFLFLFLLAWCGLSLYFFDWPHQDENGHACHTRPAANR